MTTGPGQLTRSPICGQECQRRSRRNQDALVAMRKFDRRISETETVNADVYLP